MHVAPLQHACAPRAARNTQAGPDPNPATLPASTANSRWDQGRRRLTNTPKHKVGCWLWSAKRVSTARRDAGRPCASARCDAQWFHGAGCKAGAARARARVGARRAPTPPGTCRRPPGRAPARARPAPPSPSPPARTRALGPRRRRVRVRPGSGLVGSRRARARLRRPSPVAPVCAACRVLRGFPGAPRAAAGARGRHTPGIEQGL